MPILHRLKQTINQSGLLQGIYDLSKIIIEFSLLYLVREGISEEDGQNIKPKLDPCEVDFLKPSEMKIISSSLEVSETENVLLKRLSEGQLCIGIKHHNDIAAYMWCNLRECTYIRYNLGEDEVYLWDARTISSYRGKSLAPYLRVELYRHLRQMGRTKFISLTNYFNTPAIRFKEKLNAKPEKLYLSIRLFKKYERAILLRSYKN